MERVFFQIQQAHWFYVDEWADPEGWDDETTDTGTEYEDGGAGGGARADGVASLGLRLRNSRAVLPYLRFDAFSRLMFASSPMLHEYCDQHVTFKAAFKAYMNTIPRFGCILLNSAMTHLLLVQGHGSKTYGWPRGKVNQGEAGIDCAGREAHEETGFNPRELLRERDFLEVPDKDGSTNRLYIGVGVPDDGSVPFAPTLAKEVDDIAWVELASIDANGRRGVALTPGGGFKEVRLFGLFGFVRRLHSWISAQRAANGKQQPAGNKAAKRAARAAREAAAAAAAAAPATASKAKATMKPEARARAAAAAPASGYSTSASMTSSLLEPITGSKGWSVQEMFAQNARILGRDFTYDGNPHDFGVYDDGMSEAEMAARSGVRPVRVSVEEATARAEKSAESAARGSAAAAGSDAALPSTKTAKSNSGALPALSLLTAPKPSAPSAKLPSPPQLASRGANEAPFRFDAGRVMASFGVISYNQFNVPPPPPPPKHGSKRKEPLSIRRAHYE